jgi:hypothetical protein
MQNIVYVFITIITKRIQTFLTSEFVSEGECTAITIQSWIFMFNKLLDGKQVVI